MDATDAIEWVRKAMRPLILLAMMLTPLAACAEHGEAKVNLALTCQLRKCVCAERDRLFLKSADPEPVLWKQNGDAYCPEGLELRLVEE